MASRNVSRRTQVAAHYRTRIYDGALNPGDYFPTVREIAQQQSVSISTAHGAVEMLRRWGLITTVERETITVAPRPHVPHPLHRLARMAEGQPPLLPGETSRITSAGLVDPAQVPIEVLDALDLTPGDDVARREGIVLYEQTTTELTIVWHPRCVTELCPEVTQTTPITRGTVNALRDRGVIIHPDASSYQLRMRYCTEGESTLLDIEPGRPILAMTSVRYQDTGRPVEYLEFVFPGNQLILTP